MPCEKGSSMVRRFSIPPLHRQRLSFQPPQVLSVPTTGAPVWRKGGWVQKEGRELWLPGGQRQDVGNKGIFLRTLFIPNQSPSSSHQRKAPKCLNQMSDGIKLKWYNCICCHPIYFLIFIHRKKNLNVKWINLRNDWTGRADIFWDSLFAIIHDWCMNWSNVKHVEPRGFEILAFSLYFISKINTYWFASINESCAGGWHGSCN